MDITINQEALGEFLNEAMAIDDLVGALGGLIHIFKQQTDVLEGIIAQYATLGANEMVLIEGSTWEEFEAMVEQRRALAKEWINESLVGYQQKREILSRVLDRYWELEQTTQNSVEQLDSRMDKLLQAKRDYDSR